MTAATVQEGDAFTMPYGQTRLVPHLWVAVTAAEGSPPRALMVSMTSDYPGKPGDWVVEAGIHPKIVRSSIVFYAQATVMDLTTLEGWVQRGVAQVEAPASAAFLASIREGFLKTDLLDPSVDDYCLDHLKL